MRWLLVIVICALPLAAQEQVDPTRAFYRARELFDQQDFAGAVAAYESALAGKKTSPAFLYNLGTACLRAGKNGKALYYLRLAEQLAPRDENIERNIAVARKRAKDAIPKEKQNALLAALLVLHDETTPREAFFLFVVLFLGGMLLLHLRLFVGGAWLGRIAIVLIVVGLSLGVSAYVRSETTVDEAVVLVDGADVFNGPNELSYEVYFILNAGAEVEVLELQPNWALIQAGDKKGYLPRSQLGLL